jgi:hypothetical protein
VVNRLLQAADRYEGRFKATFNRAVREGRAKVRVGQAARAFARRDRAGVELEALKGLTAMTKRLEATIESPILSCLAAGADVAAAALPRKARSVKVARAKTPRITFRFDRTNPQATIWARQHAADLVTDVTGETRKAIRRVITRAFTDNLPPRESARLLRKIVGLTESQEESLDRLRHALQENPGKMVRMGERKFRAPTTKTGIQNIIERQSDRMLRNRSIMIARTETIRASNEGQTQLWMQAVAAGKLPRNVERIWITTQGACPEICEPLESKRASLNGSFEGKYEAPPAHPGCRCTTGIVA